MEVPLLLVKVFPGDADPLGLAARGAEAESLRRRQGLGPVAAELCAASAAPWGDVAAVYEQLRRAGIPPLRIAFRATQIPSLDVRAQTTLPGRPTIRCVVKTTLTVRAFEGVEEEEPIEPEPEVPEDDR